MIAQSTEQNLLGHVLSYLMQTTPTMRIHKLVTEAVIVIITTATSESKINYDVEGS